jgi:hypothetical protein
VPLKKYSQAACSGIDENLLKNTGIRTYKKPGCRGKESQAATGKNLRCWLLDIHTAPLIDFAALLSMRKKLEAVSGCSTVPSTV